MQKRRRETVHVKKSSLVIILILVIGFVLPVSADSWNAQNAWAPPASATSWSPETIITVDPTIKVNNVKRLGINIGAYDQFGAAQYLKNVIPNPGLEAGEFGMIMLAASGAGRTRVQPNQWFPPLNAQADGMWDGARYEVLSGPATGQGGTIRQFRREQSRYTFYLNGNDTKLEERDAVMVTKQIPGYFTETPTKFHEPDNERRPGSPGVQSLRIHPSNWQPGWATPLDSFSRDGDNSAGKLRIVQGNWGYEFWVKAEQPGQSLEVKFHRVREKVFHQEVIPLTTRWQKIERRFFVPVGADAMKTGIANPLTFELRIASGDGDVLFDDVELGSLDHRNPTVFSDKFVNVLRELNPGVVRYWGRQLGSTLDNQLAEQWARKTVGYNPYEADPLNYNYSLPDFLNLARHIGAEPWYVIPPTFTPSEMRNLVAYLSAPAGSHAYADIRVAQGQYAPWTSVFGVIHLEYGNEMWGGNTHGDPFHGASFWNGDQLGTVANARLGFLRSAKFFNDAKLNLMVGGQAGYPGRQGEIEAVSSNHDGIAVAPYYGSDYTVFNNQQNIYQPLFANPTQMVAEAGKMSQSRDFIDANKEMAIYEINSHLTKGYIPVAQRNQFVTSMGSGIAMPLHMLTYETELGIRTQAAFTALQYSFQMPGRGGERVRLWGMLRDLEATGRKRPAWLGLEIVNHAIQGNAITTVHSGANPTWTQNPMNGITSRVTVPYVQSFAFNQGKNYGLAMFNLHMYDDQPVQIKLPAGANGRATLYKLTSNSITDNNEDAENVRITTEVIQVSNGMKLTLPPHSIYVLDWTSY